MAYVMQVRRKYTCPNLRTRVCMCVHVQHRLIQQLGNNDLLHYLQSVTKINCIAGDPAFALLLSQIADLAFTDHNRAGKRDHDGLPVAKGRVCIDPTHV